MFCVTLPLEFNYNGPCIIDCLKYCYLLFWYCVCTILIHNTSHLYILLFLAVRIMSSSVYSISALVSQLDSVRLKLQRSHLGSKLTTGCFPYFLPYCNKYQLCHIENVGHKMFYTDGLKIIYCTKWFLGKYFTWDTSLHVKE